MGGFSDGHKEVMRKSLAKSMWFPENVPCPKCVEIRMEKTQKGYKCSCSFSATTDYLVGYWDAYKEI